jgi:hypothetical protein
LAASAPPKDRPDSTTGLAMPTFLSAKLPTGVPASVTVSPASGTTLPLPPSTSKVVAS